MESNHSKKYIHFQFSKPIYENIKDIYFKKNINKSYLNQSYINYNYEIDNNDSKIIFNGFFKDNYFLIFIDFYNTNLQNSIYFKDVIIIKLDWILQKYKHDLFLWEIKIQKKNYKYFNMPIRKIIEENTDYSIDDILLINKCIHYDVKIEETKSTKKNIFNYLFN